jgi:hypothetical protein
VNRYHACIDCSAPVKFAHRDRCHVCHRRAEHAALKDRCARCRRLRHLGPDDLCAACVRAIAPTRAAKTICCAGCGQQRRNVGHGLCSRCNQADPDRPFRYASSVAGRMSTVPPWWEDLATFAAARHHPGGAISILRDTARILATEPTAGPQSLLASCAGASSTSRALTAFFTSRGLVLRGDDQQRRSAARRHHFLDAVPTVLAAGVSDFNRCLLDERERAQRSGRRPLADVTVETKLRILRDLAVHLSASRPLTGWAEVTTADLDAWISLTPARRRQLTYVLRGFFGWAKRRKLLLIDPAKALRLGAQPPFNGTVVGVDMQRALMRRWTSPHTHPHERLTGLLALLHAASNAQIRAASTADIDRLRQTVNLASRPFPTPLDPATWAALHACLRHRDDLHTLNPHVIVTGVTRTRDTAAHKSYLTRKLGPSGTTPAACRQTRLADLVTRLDPKLTAAALGMNDGGLVRYLDDNIAQDRLDPATVRA